MAVQEVACVAKHLHEQGEAYGIDGNRLSFAGDSGGAHLSLAATMYLREELGGSDYVKCLLLFYGWYGLKDSASQRLLHGTCDDPRGIRYPPPLRDVRRRHPRVPALHQDA